MQWKMQLNRLDTAICLMFTNHSAVLKWDNAYVHNYADLLKMNSENILSNYM